jgi:hypothetical protein
MSIATAVSRMENLAAPLEEAGDARRHFHSVYLRTTRVVADEIRAGHFADPDWVERWDVLFADLYLDALEQSLAGQPPSRPWEVAFRAAEQSTTLPPLRHVLFGMNAHINYDLPQALIGVISPAEFGDRELLARRERDHLQIDRVLLDRVGAEDDELATQGPRSLTDRLLAPLNRLGTKRFLTEARRKVWHNTLELNLARQQGDDAYREKLARLETLSEARVADLTAPGQVLIKLAVRGFGVSLPPELQPTESPRRSR